jgi:post-segregation antitoxin (ccd killing protein)
MNELGKAYTCKKSDSTRVRKDYWKKTVSVTLPQNIVEKARNHGLNISRITENALSSIIDYLETQNTQTSSAFLGEASFLKKVLAGPTGIEPATYGLRVRRSNLTELRAQGLSLGRERPLKDIELTVSFR